MAGSKKRRRDTSGITGCYGDSRKSLFQAVDRKYVLISRRMM